MHNLINRISKIESIIAFTFFVVFCIFFVPSMYHEIRIHDTFDGNFSTRHVLINSGHFFDTDPTAIVPGIMNGLPRGVFPRFTEITSLLMYFFGSLNGFGITFILVRLFAFLGVFLFGKDHLKISKYQKGLLFLVASAFACLPFFVIHGLTVAGLPLVLWAFFNVYKKQKTRISILVFVLFVLWSNFVLVGFHLAISLGLLAVYFSIKEKKVQLNLFLVIAFITVLYILSDYMLFYMHLFNKGYHSSRGEMERVTALNIFGVLGGTFRSFFSGDYSTANYFGIIFILPLCYAFFLGIKKLVPNKENHTIFFSFIAITFFCALFINLLDWTKFAFFYEKFSFAKEFNFKRFTSLLPGFFFLMILVSILIINNKLALPVRLFSSFFIITLFFFIWRGNISYNRSAFDTKGITVFSEQKVTFNEFFDPMLYSKIKQEIGADTLRNVIHFGLSPAASKYAGLNVLDDYQGDYPKEYKSEFRSVIEGELNKSEKLKSYFDNWGSRCYMESANSFENSLIEKNGLLYEPDLNLNSVQLKKMNCSYILSAIVIENATKLNLTMKKVLVGTYNYKPIFLYKVI